MSRKTPEWLQSASKISVGWKNWHRNKLRWKQTMGTVLLFAERSLSCRGRIAIHYFAETLFRRVVHCSFRVEDVG